MRCSGERPHGDRARGLIAVLWRAGLGIQEALNLTELDLDRQAEIRRTLPSLANRRPAAYRWPTEATV